MEACSPSVMLEISEVVPDDATSTIGNLMGLLIYTILRAPDIKNPLETALVVGSVIYTVVEREMEERIVN